MLLNSEMLLLVGAFVLQEAGATRPFRKGLERLGRPGSKNMRKRILGFPRNLGDPAVSTEAVPDGDAGRTTPGPQAAARSRGGSEKCVLPWYRPREGNEVRGEERQEVAVP